MAVAALQLRLDRKTRELADMTRQRDLAEMSADAAWEAAKLANIDRDAAEEERGKARRVAAGLHEEITPLREQVYKQNLLIIRLRNEFQGEK